MGADWQVAEVREIATALLGTVDLIAEPEQMAADFEAIMQQSMGRGVADASLRVWAPQGAQVLFVRQVVADGRGPHHAAAGGQRADRCLPDRRLGRRVARLPRRRAAAREGGRPGAARPRGCRSPSTTRSWPRAWSRPCGPDDTLTTRIDPAVAHYTGQTELAEAIQEGLAAKAAGDDDTATTKLGRAVQLAAETGNDEATTKLRKVVEIEDADTGTVRLKRSVDKLDEMALDTASTKTTRVKK